MSWNLSQSSIHIHVFFSSVTASAAASPFSSLPASWLKSLHSPSLPSSGRCPQVHSQLSAMTPFPFDFRFTSSIIALRFLVALSSLLANSLFRSSVPMKCYVTGLSYPQVVRADHRSCHRAISHRAARVVQYLHIYTIYIVTKPQRGPRPSPS